VSHWSLEARQKVTLMQVGLDAVHSDVCSMLDQLHQLKSSYSADDDSAQTMSLIDSVNSALRKLPPNSFLHTLWPDTQSQYEETVALISHRHAELVEACRRLDPDAKNCCTRIETPSCHNSANISDPFSIRQKSNAGNQSPPVCHVKPTQVLNESTTRSSTAPFDVRNYLIDKTAPITEPVFKPQLTCVVQDSSASSSEVVRRQSSDAVAPVDMQCMRPSSSHGTADVQSVSRPAAPSLTPVHSRWKVLRKKAVGLFIDGLARSPTQSECANPRQLGAKPASTDNSQRLEYCCSQFYSGFDVKVWLVSIDLAKSFTSSVVMLFASFHFVPFHILVNFHLNSCSYNLVVFW